MKIVFLNDTSIGHSGSRAASLCLRRCLREHSIIHSHPVGNLRATSSLKTALQDCDAVFVNGEGTIHHPKRNHHARFLLNVIREAQGLGKKTLLVNSLLQGDLRPYSAEIRNLDFLSVREPHSMKVAHRFGGKPVLLADSCLGYSFYHKGAKFYDFKGAVVRGFTHPSAKCRNIMGKLDHIQAGLHSNFNDFVATISTASCYVTGQHHGCYAAGIAGIPFIPIPSNTHKIGALIEWSGCKIPICKSESQIKQVLEDIDKLKPEFDKFHKWIVQLPILTEDMVLEVLPNES